MTAGRHLWDDPTTRASDDGRLSDADWLSRNDDVLRLGLHWIDDRLSGNVDTNSRTAYLNAREAMIEEGRPSALDIVARSFCLAQWDDDVLLAALAPAIDASVGPRYGALQGQTCASPCTPHVLARLIFGCERLPPQAMLRLTHDAPLRQFALIIIENEQFLPMGAAIHLPARVRNLLCGFATSEIALDEHVEQLQPVPLPEPLQGLTSTLSLSAEIPVRLQIVGPAGAGRTALATAVLEVLGFGTLAVKKEAMLVGLESILAREAVLAHSGIVLCFDAAAESTPNLARRLDRLLSFPLVLVGETPVDGVEHMPVIRIDCMTPFERAALWRRAFPGSAENDVLTVAEQFALGPSQIASIARQPGIAQRSLWTVCRNLGARDLEALSTRVTPRRCWDDIILATETRSALDALVSQVAKRAEVNGSWGFRRVLGRATGVGALFAGPSGVGKTMAAEIIAGALELDLYVVDLARVTSKYIGETEKNLRQIFDAAERGGVVLFFDEADALFGKRSEVNDSHDRYANAEVSYLLQRMETYGGLAILATNLKTHLDTAFLRRLRMVIDFPMPDIAARLAIWRRVIPETAPQNTIDWLQLARLDLSPSNIVTIAANAAYRACADCGVIEMRHLNAAVAAEYRKLDRDASGLGNVERAP